MLRRLRVVQGFPDASSDVCRALLATVDFLADARGEGRRGGLRSRSGLPPETEDDDDHARDDAPGLDLERSAHCAWPVGDTAAALTDLGATPRSRGAAEADACPINPQPATPKRGPIASANASARARANSRTTRRPSPKPAVSARARPGSASRPRTRSKARRSDKIGRKTSLKRKKEATAPKPRRGDSEATTDRREVGERIVEVDRLRAEVNSRRKALIEAEMSLAKAMRQLAETGVDIRTLIRNERFEFRVTPPQPGASVRREFNFGARPDQEKRLAELEERLEKLQDEVKTLKKDAPRSRSRTARTSATS